MTTPKLRVDEKTTKVLCDVLIGVRRQYGQSASLGGSLRYAIDCALLQAGVNCADEVVGPRHPAASSDSETVEMLVEAATNLNDTFNSYGKNRLPEYVRKEFAPLVAALAKARGDG